MSLSIDVVIPTSGRWALTERCLRHLENQTMPHSVIVADNASPDGTRENIRAAFPEVHLVELDRNLGFPVACNRGAEAGAGDVIVLLNNDVEARVDFLENLVRPLEDDVRVGSAAALLVQPGGQTIDSIGLTADRTMASFPRLRGRPVADAASPSSVLAGPAGAGGAYRRRAWEEVGGLDEGVLFYGEDLDLALRLRAAGWRTVAVPTAIGTHLGSASFGLGSAWQRYQSGFARGYFLRRYGVMQGRTAARAFLTESIVVVGDGILRRDVDAFRGRVAGWRAAKKLPPAPTPPREAVDEAIGFFESLRLRRVIYAG
jgi:N-acetylglucosaminyl-diphospho-decaprenol L-rhamnosyltransferase